MSSLHKVPLQIVAEGGLVHGKSYIVPADL